MIIFHLRIPMIVPTYYLADASELVQFHWPDFQI